MSRRKGSKHRILEFFLDNLGRVLESREIQEASGGAVEWARRVRELRNEEGYQILTHKDRADLNPISTYWKRHIGNRPSSGASRKKRARGCWSEMGIPAKCAAPPLVIPIHWEENVPFD